jgi:hypothetical protein
MYARSYLLGSEEAANEQGSWYSWTMGDVEVARGVREYARAFCESLKAGAVKVNYEELNPANDTHDGGGSGGDAPGDLDNDIDA